MMHEYVSNYINQWRNGDIVLNQYRIKLIEYVEKVVLKTKGVYFNYQQIEDCVNFIEKYYFRLEPFQKFLLAFVFLYHVDGQTVFDRFFWTMARGAGKNGLISGLAHYLSSPLYGVPEYHIAIVANSERQAKKSFMEVHNMLKRNPILTERDSTGYAMYKNGLAQILCNDTLTTIEYLTSNADTKDSFAHGVVIFDEIHQYDNYEVIDVLTDGLGKVQPPRAFFISTNGYVREGVYDKELQKAIEILSDTELKSRTFPWICTLDSAEEVEDTNNWQKSNPMFHPPMSLYATGLFNTVLNQWGEVQRGERNKAQWLVKRQNLSEVEMESSVATRADILATNQHIPDLKNQICVGGLDYASMRDFASVGCLFYQDDKFYWITHSFVRKGFLDNEALAISPEIPEWQNRGLLTVIDEPSISIHYIVDWFKKMRDEYGLTMIVGDTYRLDLVKPAFEEAGLELEYIRRSGAIEAKVAPEIEVLFAQQKIVYGDNPLMRWFTNNVYVKRDKFGNMQYNKKDERKRKTDGFMAFVHAFWKANDVLVQQEATEFVFEDFWG